MPEKWPIFISGDLHNLGDLKLLLVNLGLAGGDEKAPIGWVKRWNLLDPAITVQVEKAGGQIIAGKALWSLIKQAYGAQIVFGGGQLVRDNVSLFSQVSLLLAVVSAKLGGGRFTTRGLGVSPIQSPIRRIMWKWILSNKEPIQLRDHVSARNLSHLLPRQYYNVNADMVFLAANNRVKNSEKARSWIVVAPCADAREQRGIEGETLDRLIVEATRVCPNARIMIACHDSREDMDKTVAHALKERWSDWDVTILEGYNLAALQALYDEAQLVLTNRLHAMIFSALAEAPVLAIEDGAQKVSTIASQLGVPIAFAYEQQDAVQLIQQALDYDRDARNAALQRLAQRAERNLT